MPRYAKYLPADERRAATVETVVRLAADQNPSDITTAAIASKMGVTHGALFKHFPSKDAILQAVMEWVAASLMTRVEKAIAPGSPPLDALEAMFLAHVAFVAEHPGVPRMLFGELQRPGVTGPKRVARALLRRYGERVLELIASGKASGALDANLDAKAAASLFIGTIQGLVMQSLLRGDMSQITIDAPRVFAIYRRGIGNAP
ncbi:MAG: TetR family transcriptional regulator [Gemmatimonas sp.]|nr:TetR family transcriptional regulator [Gemmatimonas sp.]